MHVHFAELNRMRAGGDIQSVDRVLVETCN